MAKANNVVETDTETQNENVFLTDGFWSAVKRKAMNEILATVFESHGFSEAALIAKDTTRMTDAAITRMREAMAISSEVEETTTEDVTTESEEETTGKKHKKSKKDEEVVEETMAKDAADLTYADNVTAPLTVGDIKALIASGKKKNLKAANKAFKEQFGKDHPEHKELKKLLKKAGK